MKSARAEKVVWKHISPETSPPCLPAGADEIGVFLQAKLAVPLADPFGGLEGEDSADAAPRTTSAWAARQPGGRGRLGTVVDRGHAAAQHLQQHRSVAAQISSWSSRSSTSGHQKSSRKGQKPEGALSSGRP